MYTPFNFTLYPKEIKLVYTDIALKVPVGHYGRIAPKSGLTLRHHVTVLAGVVDPDYTGNMGVVLYNLSSDTKFTPLVGEPIAQLILEVASIFPTLEINALPPTARGPYGLAAMIKPEELLEFQNKFEQLMEAFYNTILIQGQDVCITNLSRIQERYINLHIYYRKGNGRTVQVETMGVIDHRYQRALKIIGNTLWEVTQEADRDTSLFLTALP